jgi:hypothetical protein
MTLGLSSLLDFSLSPSTIPQEVNDIAVKAKADDLTYKHFLLPFIAHQIIIYNISTPRHLHH